MEISGPNSNQPIHPSSSNHSIETHAKNVFRSTAVLATSASKNASLTKLKTHVETLLKDLQALKSHLHPKDQEQFTATETHLNNALQSAKKKETYAEILAAYKALIKSLEGTTGPQKRILKAREAAFIMSILTISTQELIITLHGVSGNPPSSEDMKELLSRVQGLKDLHFVKDYPQVEQTIQPLIDILQNKNLSSKQKFDQFCTLFDQLSQIHIPSD